MNPSLFVITQHLANIIKAIKVFICLRLGMEKARKQGVYEFIDVLVCRLLSGLSNRFYYRGNVLWPLIL